MPVITTGFKPKEHGFRFVNSFNFDAKFDLPLVGQVDLGKIVYGLCGGMCFAATDYYMLSLPVPDYKRPEEIPSRFRNYLWDRQLDSLGLTTIPKVIEWMLQDDLELAKRTARNEAPKMRRRLDKGEPVILALIRAKGGGDPTQNHQVLAVGYEEDPVSRQMTIRLYEPNHPGLEPTLTLNLAHPSQGIGIKQSTGEALRGFFVIPYRFQQPPADLRAGL